MTRTCRRAGCGATFEGPAQSRLCSDACRRAEKRDQMRTWHENHWEHASGTTEPKDLPVDPAEVAWVQEVPEAERTLWPRWQAKPWEAFARDLNRLMAYAQGGQPA